MAAQRLAAVVGDHVEEGGRHVEFRAGFPGLVEVGVGAVQVADDALAIVQAGLLAQVGLPGGLER